MIKVDVFPISTKGTNDSWEFASNLIWQLRRRNASDYHLIMINSRRTIDSIEQNDMRFNWKDENLRIDSFNEIEKSYVHWNIETGGRCE